MGNRTSTPLAMPLSTTVAPSGPVDPGDFLATIHAEKPRGDALSNTVDLLCADSRYSEEECRQLRGATKLVDFDQMTHGSFANLDTQDRVVDLYRTYTGVADTTLVGEVRTWLGKALGQN